MQICVKAQAAGARQVLEHSLVQPEGFDSSALWEAHLGELAQRDLVHPVLLILIQHGCTHTNKTELRFHSRLTQTPVSMEWHVLTSTPILSPIPPFVPAPSLPPHHVICCTQLAPAQIDSSRTKTLPRCVEDLKQKATNSHMTMGFPHN